jgi:hypothetical protein
MNKKRILIIVIAIIAALTLVALAQTSRPHTHRPKGMPNPKADSVEVNEVTMAKNIVDNVKMMSQDFKDMKSNFDEMLQIENMPELKSAMLSHQRTLVMMDGRMTSLQRRCNDLLKLLEAATDTTATQ